MVTVTDTTVHTRIASPRKPSTDQLREPNGSLKERKPSADPLHTLRATQRSSPYKHLHPVHSSQRPSALSHDAVDVPSFLGFRNLMVLLLVVSNLRLVIENFNKYGVLICIRCHDYRRQDVVYGLILFLLVPAHLFVAFIIELVAAHQAKGALARTKKVDDADQSPSAQKKHAESLRSTWRMVALAHTLNATLNLIIASFVVFYLIHHPGIGTLCEIHAVIVWLKTCSYAFTNRDMRHAIFSSSPEGSIPEIYKSCPYPRNITVSNLTYFWWAPTLVYQPVYPRSSNIRWTFVFKRLAEVVVLSISIWILSAQYASPLLKNSFKISHSMSMGSFLERLMKLSTISILCWLAGFFALFHSFLNALAEVLRFGDREFYTDWWNACTIRQYWAMWNKPVHQFMRRHVYAPLVGRGVPPYLAQIFVFIFSGFLHELLVGIPTHNILGYAFAGMVFQIPLIFFTDFLVKMPWLNGKVAGNLFFWLSFCLVGQPLAAMRYFWAWQAKYGTVGKPQLSH